MNFNNIVKRFYVAAKDSPDTKLFTFCDDNGKEVEVLSYSAFKTQSESIAVSLQREYKISSGDRIVLIYPPGLAFIKAFWACVIIGAIPVPVIATLVQSPEKIKQICDSTKAKLMMVSQDIYRAMFVISMKNFATGQASAKIDISTYVADGTIPAADPTATFAPNIKAKEGDVCFLQYTSGSTSDPKGVMITFGNLSHQLSFNAAVFDRTEKISDPAVAAKPAHLRNKLVCWLPHNHDFCLISFILNAMFGNGSLVLFSPVAFIKNPGLWPELMTRYKATHSAAPNFAYDLVVRKTTLSQRSKFDLSALRVIMCAAEPISSTVVEKFCSEYAVSKLDPSAFCAAYGMAENTVGISVWGRKTVAVDRLALEADGKIELSDKDQHDVDHVRVLIGCGPPCPETSVRIVDVQTMTCLPDGTIGEIWVNSPSKAAGYYGREEDSKELFYARISNRPKEFSEPNEYLRTGDMGCMYEGEVFVTGRLKDMIIFAGRNVYPQDIEETIRNAHDLIRKGGVAVLSLTAQEVSECIGDVSEEAADEQIIAVVEMVEDIDEELNREVVSVIRRAIQRAHHISGTMVILCKQGSVAKTTSGKVQRVNTKAKLLKGNIDSAIKGSSNNTGLLGTMASVLINVIGSSAPNLPEDKRRKLFTYARTRNSSRRSSTQSLSFEAVNKEGKKRALAVDDMAESFRSIIGSNIAFFNKMTKIKGGRVFHKEATTLVGKLEITNPILPVEQGFHMFFADDAKYSVLLRFANGIQNDDRVPDNRGATMRVYRNSPEVSIWDVLFTSGHSFTSGTAAEFETWRKSSYAERVKIAEQNPHISEAAWDMNRQIESYTDIYYYSKIASEVPILDQNGKHVYYAKFRIIPASRVKDSGYLDRKGQVLPPETFKVDPSDTRSRDFLHQGLKSKIAKEEIVFILQAQFYKKRREGDDEMLDCSKAWPESKFQWHDLGKIRLEKLFESQVAVDDFEFNPLNAPSTLQVPLASKETEYASLAHMRMIIYHFAALSRKNVHDEVDQSQLNLFLQSEEKHSKKLKIAVLGAGVCGLTSAYELKKLGHEVSVFEPEDFIGGKCGSTEIEGLQYDWGGHVCTDMYKTVMKVMKEIGVTEIEDVTPTIVWDNEKKSIERQDRNEQLKNEFFKYQKLKDEHFPLINSPNLVEVTNYEPIVEPVQKAAKQLGLERLVYDVGLRFTSCGYGFATDPELPLMYPLKAAETASILSTGNADKAWTVKGGFGKFWEKVAAKIGTVRLKEFPKHVSRSKDGVVLEFSDRSFEEFDKVIITTNKRPELLGKLIDMTPEEEDIFSQVRSYEYYTTAVKIEGKIPQLGFYIFKQYCENSSFTGYPVCYHHRFPGVNNYLVYSYGDSKNGINGKVVTEKTIEAFTEMGCKVTKVFWQKKWDYFPHFTSDAIKKGYQLRLEELQGKNNTYYTGSLFNFELIECNMAHVTAMVGKYFAPKSSLTKAVTMPSALLEELKGASHDERISLILKHILNMVTEHMKASGGLHEELDAEDAFSDMGFDSIISITFSGKLSKDLGFTVQPTVFFDHETPLKLAEHFASAVAAKFGEKTDMCASVVFEEVAPIELGKNDGVPFYLHVFKPKEKLNGSAVIEVTSDGWFSDDDVFDLYKSRDSPSSYCSQGFTLFSIRPGSRPRVTLYMMLENIKFAVKWIKSRAHEFGIDPRRIVVSGSSSGGQLALLTALNSTPSNPKPTKIESSFVGLSRHDSSVLGVVAFFPVADAVVTHGKESSESERIFREALGAVDAPRAVFEEQRRAFSPIHNIGGSLPTLLKFVRIYHGLSDEVIAPQGSADFIETAKAKGLEAEFFERNGGHHYEGVAEDIQDVAAWLKVKVLIADVSSTIPLSPVMTSSKENRAMAQKLAPELAAQFKKNPSRLEGSLNSLYIAFAARISSRNSPKEPMFPELISKTVDFIKAQGSLSTSFSHPYCEWITLMAFATTLDLWHTHGFANYTTAIKKCLELADVALVKLLDADSKMVSYEPFYRFHAFPGIWLVQANEARPFLESHWLNGDQKQRLQAYLSKAPRTEPKLSFSKEQYSKMFQEDSLTLAFGEYLNDEALNSYGARENVRRNPFFQPAFTMRYFEVTKDQSIENVVQKLKLSSPSSGFVPRASLTDEVLFSVYYLVRGGVDVAKYFPEQLEYVRKISRPEGVSVEENGRTPDCDQTAMAVHISNLLDLKYSFKTESLEKFWMPDVQAYKSPVESNDTIVSVCAHVLEAYLSDPTLPKEKKNVIWNRVIGIFEQKPWVEIFNLSPLGEWEKIAYIGFKFQKGFTKTDVHHKALNLTIAAYDSVTGGFTSRCFNQPPNLEETAIGLLTIKHALESDELAPSTIEVLQSIKVGAEAFIKKQLPAGLKNETPINSYPEFWVTKVTASLPNLAHATALAALNK